MFDVYNLAAGILIGLSLAVPPGPVNAVIAAESVKESYVNGIKVGLGALTADATFLVIALIGVAVFFNNAAVKTVVSLIGGAILAYMAFGILKDFRKPIKPSKGIQAAYDVIRKYVDKLEEDRPLFDDINKLKEVVESGEILEAVEKTVGPLK